MAGVFVSYRREDENRAKRVVEALRADGFEVWWDQGIGSGASWRNEIRQRIEAASVICVLWSSTSVRSEWVAEEAERGKERDVLCPALIDNVRPPIGFGGIQASNLIGWNGNRSDPAWKYYADCVRARLSGATLPERRPPRPRPSAWRIASLAIGAAVTLVTFLGAAEQFGLINLMSDSAVGTARRISPAERAEWAGVRDSHNCVQIRQYINANPAAAFATEAQALLTAKRIVNEPSWQTFAAEAPVVATSSMEYRGNREAACEAAQARVLDHGEQVCSPYMTTGSFHRAVSVDVADGECECNNNAIQIPGAAEATPLWICTVRTVATCRGESREDVTREVCGS